jgi:hypothetical protein
MTRRKCLRLISPRSHTLHSVTLPRLAIAFLAPKETSPPSQRYSTKAISAEHASQYRPPPIVEVSYSSLKKEKKIVPMSVMLEFIQSRRQKQIDKRNQKSPSPLEPPSDYGINDYWSFEGQRTSKNKPVVIKYARSVGKANFFVSTLKGPFLAMDLEWVPFGPTNVSLVQICDEESIVLIHLSLMRGMSLLFVSLI